MNARSRLADVRADPRRRYALMAAGAVAGTALASVHWIGFVLGGAAVGVLAAGLGRALVAGAAYGIAAWLAFLGTLALGGALGPALDTGRILAVSVAVPVLTGTLGSLARGMV